jgi:hypothetical protein
VFNGEPHDDVLECADMIKIQMALNVLTRCRSGQLSDVLPCSVLWASDSNSLICLQPKPINGGSMVIRAEEADNYVMVKKRIISITIDT